MEKKEAKELTLKVWGFLRDNPEINNKDKTPYWDDIQYLTGFCPLCE